MPPWKRLLLSAYYYGSYPVRCRNWRHCLAEDRVPVIVLLYHRVADDGANDWTVSNETFARQIRWLQDHFELISLEEAQQVLRRGRNRRRCAAITFDDGYAENCHQAIPLLVKEGIPCTYFVTLQNVLQCEPFSHDLVRGNEFAPNTLEQLKAMSAAGIEIGAHTCTHTDLGAISDRRLLRYEVVSAGEELQQSVGRRVRYFAFPFGHHANLNCEAFDLARRAGYEAVCSAYGGYNFPGDDPFHLQRIPLDEYTIRLKNWATLDPRKLRTPRFAYETQEITTKQSVGASTHPTSRTLEL